MLDETDLAIVNALEVQPRIEFTALAQVLGMSPATVARRWESLVESGQAWVTISPGPRHHEVGWSAFLSIAADVGEQNRLAERLCAEPSFASVLLTSGENQFLVDCFASSAEESMRLLTDVFPRLPGVIRRRIDPITKVYRLGSQWRSGVLEVPVRKALEADAPRVTGQRIPDRVDSLLLEALAVDGRAGWQQIADLAGVSAQTAKRRVSNLIESGFMAFRCDTSTSERSGLQEVIIDWSIPNDSIDEVGARLAADPMCRVSSQVLAAANFTATLWVHDYRRVQDHEAQVLAVAPRAAVVERHAALRPYKRMGQVLGADGRRFDTVPVTWWKRPRQPDP